MSSIVYDNFKLFVAYCTKMFYVDRFCSKAVYINNIPHTNTKCH